MEEGGPEASETVLLRDRTGDTGTEETPCEDGGRDRSGTVTGQGHLEPLGARRGRKDPPPKPPEGMWP